MKLKKYFGLGTVLALSFALGVIPAFAENSTSANTNTQVKAKVEQSAPASPVKAQVKATTANQVQTQTSGLKTEAGLNTTTKTEIKTQRAQISEELAAKREELRLEVEKRKAELKAEIEAKATEMGEKKEEMQKTAEQLRLEKRNEVKDRIFANFAKVAENLAQINERINSRIKKMQEAGADISVAEKLIINAESSLTSAIAFSNDVKVKLESDATVEEIRQTAEFARSAYKDAHKYLVEAVNELKAILEREREVKVNSITEVNVTGEVAE